LIIDGGMAFEEGRYVMGMLVEGQWQDVWYDTASTGGKFVRKDSAFRYRIALSGLSGGGP
jgi:glutathionyl-hydroquinone reductase